MPSASTIAANVTFFEYRLDSRIDRSPGSVAQRLVRIGAVGDHFAGAMEDGVGEQLGARAALVEADLRQPRQVQHAQHDDDRADDRRDAEDLLALDA